MSLYDREYMRDDKTERSETRRPGVVAEYRKSISNRLGRGEQVGFVIAAAGVIALLLGIAFL
jgi:hypothetical protein